MARTSALRIVGIAALVASVAACGDSKEEPKTGDDVAPTGTAQTTPPDSTGTATTATPSATASTPPASKGPGKTGAFVEGNKKSLKGGKIAAFIKPEDEASVRGKLDAAVEKDGEGFQFEGAPSAAKFKQGEVLELTVTVQPGKCYTVVAVSADGGITELDGSVLVSAPPGLPIPVPPQPIATDTSTGPNVTMGGGANCFKSSAPAAAPATVQIKATKGAGVAAVQILSK